MITEIPRKLKRLPAKKECRKPFLVCKNTTEIWLLAKKPGAIRGPEFGRIKKLSSTGFYIAFLSKNPMVFNFLMKLCKNIIEIIQRHLYNRKGKKYKNKFIK